MGILEPLLSADHLYDYRGRLDKKDDDAPPLWLPHHQGDVFRGLDLPGLPTDPAGLAMLFQHPCTMRAGAVLKPRATVIRVEKRAKEVIDDPDEWASQYAVMPLPDLMAMSKDTHVANFMSIATIQSSVLDRRHRIAVLSVAGRMQLQQRIIHHLTRFAPSTQELYEATAGVEAEISLQADWVERAVQKRGADDLEVVVKAEAEFDEYMSADNRRAALSILAESHRIISEVNREMAARYPGDGN